MRTLLTALALTAGLYACASDKPAESPATSSSTTSSTMAATPATPNTTTTTTTSAATPDATMTGSANAVPAAGSMPAPTDTMSPAPAAPPATTDASKGADNTKQNQRDRNGSTLTPMDQGGAKGDRDITAAIRRSVVGDNAMSWDAKNVKIITQGGKVTLRGAVKTDAEKAAIETKAKLVAGVMAVDNQLDVKK